MANKRLNERLLRAVRKYPPLDIESIKKILDLGADPNYSDGGEPALVTASKNHPSSVVELLLEFGADPNAWLTEAIEYSSCRLDIRMTTSLIQHGAIVKNAEMAMYGVCSQSFFDSIEDLGKRRSPKVKSAKKDWDDDVYRMMQLLFDNGANANRDERPPQFGNLPCVSLCKGNESAYSFLQNVHCVNIPPYLTKPIIDDFIESEPPWYGTLVHKIGRNRDEKFFVAIKFLNDFIYRGKEFAFARYDKHTFNLDDNQIATLKYAGTRELTIEPNDELYLFDGKSKYRRCDVKEVRSSLKMPPFQPSIVLSEPQYFADSTQTLFQMYLHEALALED